MISGENQPPVVLLGLGYTTQRLAIRLLASGVPTVALVRRPERFRELESRGLRLRDLSGGNVPAQCVAVHTIPPLTGPEDDQIKQLITKIAPRRIVYLSATSVYGEIRDVTADTPAAPNDEKSRARFRDEQWLLAGPWETLILRAAAIYGPGRGIQMAVREGRVPRSAGSGIVSRIHADDLASLVEAGILSNVTGAYPIADQLPAPSAEVAAWCARQLGMNNSIENAQPFSISGRRVDGSEILRILNIKLRYPDWKTGLAACLWEEQNRPRDQASDAAAMGTGRT